MIAHWDDVEGVRREQGHIAGTWASLTGSSSVTVGVRPEHLSVAEKGWPAAVSVVEPTGSETQITARLANAVVRIIVKGRTAIRPGETIHLAAPPENIHFFDAGPVPDLVLTEDN